MSIISDNLRKAAVISRHGEAKSHSHTSPYNLDIHQYHDDQPIISPAVSGGASPAGVVVSAVAEFSHRANVTVGIFPIPHQPLLPDQVHTYISPVCDRVALKHVAMIYLSRLISCVPL